MRIGLLGVGRIGGAHAEVVQRHPDVDSLVLADATPGRAAEAAKHLGCDSASDVDEVIASGVDALVIASATESHADLIVAGARAGLPMFCEKPVAPDVETSRRVADEVRRAGVQVQIGFQRRFDTGYGAARQALREGMVGDLHRVHVVTADEKPPHSSYIPTSGGLYRDCHIHDFDILRWVTGREVVDVTAFGSNRGADFFREGNDVDNSAAVLRLDDDTLVTLQGSRYNGAGHDVRMELAGTDSTYVVGLSDRTPMKSAEHGMTFPGGEPWPNFWVRFTPAYVAEMYAFVRVAKNSAPSPCTVDDALAALYVAEAADLSMRQGRRVEVEEVAK
ncbi:MAG: Gfo/Idh/MocA family oxidoreductase [Actinomycetota bacterium]|nr:Gfo/Idh/MocA family oxidoreductase [Actinomycetota bacterium]